MWKRISTNKTLATGQSFNLDVTGMSIVAFSMYTTGGRTMQIVPTINVGISYQVNGSLWEHLTATVSNDVMIITNPSSNTTTVNIHAIFRVL